MLEKPFRFHLMHLFSFSIKSLLGRRKGLPFVQELATALSCCAVIRSIGAALLERRL
jgi:hypothetical protein